jgi:hypothetical protein
MEGSISLVDSIRSSAHPPTMRMHMRIVPNRPRITEPIIQNTYLPSLAWKFTLFFIEQEAVQIFWIL